MHIVWAGRDADVNLNAQVHVYVCCLGSCEVHRHNFVQANDTHVYACMSRLMFMRAVQAACDADMNLNVQAHVYACSIGSCLCMLSRLMMLMFMYIVQANNACVYAYSLGWLTFMHIVQAKVYACMSRLMFMYVVQANAANVYACCLGWLMFVYVVQANAANVYVCCLGWLMFMHVVYANVYACCVGQS